jgi:hypothetical protein
MQTFADFTRSVVGLGKSKNVLQEEVLGVWGRLMNTGVK